MRNVLIISGQKIPLPDDFDFSAFSSVIENEKRIAGDVRLELVVENRQPRILLNGRDISGRLENPGLELIEHGDFLPKHFNYGNGKTVVVLDTMDVVKLITPEMSELIRDCGGDQLIKIMAPVPDICCRNHIYKEEREFKKQKKEKFKSPMWNF